MVAQNHGLSVVDDACAFDVTATFTSIGVFYDVSAGLVHRHPGHIDSPRVEACRFKGRAG